MNQFLGYFVGNRVFANLLTIVILVSGLISLMLIKRELFPESSLDMITVQVIYPGADPEEVEEGICRKIEEGLDTVEGIKRYTTIAAEGMGRANIEILESYDVSKVYDKIRNAIDSISTFPKDAEKPITNEVTIRREVIEIALSGDIPEKTLKEWAEQVKDELQALPEISQVFIFGAKQYEIGIEISEEKLQKLGLTFSEVASAIRAGNLNVPGGLIRTKGGEIRVRTLGRKYYADELADIVVLARPSGEVITLGQVAEIRDDFVEDPLEPNFNGEKCVLVECFATLQEDEIEVADAVHQYVKTKQKQLPPGVSISVWRDRARMIKARLHLLQVNGIQSFCIVLIILLLLMDAHLAFFVSLGIPISFAGAICIMYIQGGTLNMNSLFGLIASLGMLVDDAIIVGESIYYHRQRGAPPMKAALLGVEEVGFPVIGAVTTTIASFLPLVFIGGIMGKFIRILPIVVISALTVSLFESLLLLPAHLNNLPDLSHTIKNTDTRRHPLKKLRWTVSDFLDHFIDNYYLPFLRFLLKHRYIAFSCFVMILLSVLGLLQGQFLKYEVSSDVDADVLRAQVEFPAGTPIHITREAVKRMEASLKRLSEKVTTMSGEPLIQNVYSCAGQSSSGFSASGGSNMGEVRAEMLPSERRGIHAKKISSMWAEETGKIPGALRQNFTAAGGGPRGTGVNLWLRSENLDDIIQASEEIKEKLGSYEGVYQIENDYSPAKIEARFNLKPEANTLGITLDSLGAQLAGGFFGEEAVRIQRGRDDIRIRVRYPREDRSYLSILNDVRIRTPQGNEVPLHTVANVEFTPGYTTITRLDGLRRIVITADIDTAKANSQEVIGDLRENFLPEVQSRHPGLIWSFEGPQEDNRDAMNSLKVGFPIALLVIFLIISTIFHSYSQTILIMFTIPFGIIGALIGHLLFRETITLMSIFGIVALAGVVVNDAIVFVDCFNANLVEGNNFISAIIQAGKRRFRAVFMTTTTTVGGMLSILFTRDLQAQFLRPMAISLAIGLLFSTTITLLLLPALIGMLNDIRRAFHIIRKGRIPTREEVEPVFAVLEERKQLKDSTL
ncbi:MAG TPA: efflux RND transporter permease subunit [Candidatus Hydrogenedens sp.]|nr:efflux RND transporter permease subunit [Candidatus Hydrogenedens sp.]